MTYRKRIPQAMGLMTLAVVGLAACSSASSAAKPAPPAAGAVTAACQRVSGVLSDGPDPDSDPLGYAEAQVAPLHRIQTQDSALRDAVGKLADAYQAFFTTNGTKTAKEAVSVASSAINKICPGATS